MGDDSADHTLDITPGVRRARAWSHFDMASRPPAPSGEHVTTADQRVVTYGVQKATLGPRAPAGRPPAGRRPLEVPPPSRGASRCRRPLEVPAECSLRRIRPLLFVKSWTLREDGRPRFRPGGALTLLGRTFLPAYETFSWRIRFRLVAKNRSWHFASGQERVIYRVL
jgi:hypothetical protein